MQWRLTLTSSSAKFLFPLAAVFGGVAQFAAGMWAYRARDAVATARHGLWGSFWIAYGILFLLVAAGDLVFPSGKFPELAFWFFPLAAITASGAVASVGRNLGLVGTLASLAAGAGLLGDGYLVGPFYTASAMVMNASFGRIVLPL